MEQMTKLAGLLIVGLFKGHTFCVTWAAAQTVAT